MNRCGAISAMIVLGLGTVGCGAFKPYDYSANRPAELDVDRETRQAREAQQEQQRIVRCQTGGSSLPRGDCN